MESRHYFENKEPGDKSIEDSSKGLMVHEKTVHTHLFSLLLESKGTEDSLPRLSN